VKELIKPCFQKQFYGCNLAILTATLSTCHPDVNRVYVKAKILNRLQHDFDLTLVTAFSALAIIGILPFGIYRYLSGNTPAAIMDLVIVACVLIALSYAWVTGHARRASIFLMIATNLGCIASATLLGLAGLFWMFPVLLMNFLMVRRSVALAFCAFSLIFLALHGKAFENTLEVMMFLVTAFVVCLLAFIYASRAETQRKQLEALSLLDPLTNTQNRRAMDHELDIAINTSSHDGKPYALAIIDLDMFKRINDKYGHEEGDQVLIDFTQLIRKNTRKMDRLFRLGGEEFVLLLPGVSETSLRVIVDNYCKIVAANLRCRLDVITVSIGATTLRAGESKQAWLSRADSALYAAKNSGRNCAVLFEDAH
jgi:diguanylate cyclase